MIAFRDAHCITRNPVIWSCTTSTDGCASPCHLSGQPDMQGLYDSVGAAPTGSGPFTLRPHRREDYAAIVSAARDQWRAVFDGTHGPARPRRFRCDTTYKRGAEYLSGIGRIEDWGCGTAYFKRFLPEGCYCGIDHDPAACCDQLADLATYTSATDGLFLRHVLEHELRRQRILRNAVASFRRRMVLVVHTPFVRATGPRRREDGPVPGPFAPEIHFCRGDLVREFPGVPFRLEENTWTDSPHGREHVFDLGKDGPA